MLPRYCFLSVVLSFVIYCLLVWWPTRNLPYHWDSAGFFINATRELEANNFSPWIAGYSDFAHPPLLMTVVALAWQWFGEGLLVSHITMMVFLPILMVSTYLIGLKVFEEGLRRSEYTHLLPEIESVGSAFLVGFLPFVLVEYGLIYIDLPAGALMVAAVAACIYRRYVLMAVLMAAAGMVKESVLIGLPVLGYLVVAQSLADEERSWSEWRVLLGRKYWGRWVAVGIPAVVYGIWLWYHLLVTGWLLVRPEREVLGAESVSMFMTSMKYIVKQLFFEQGRWLFSLGALMGLGVILFNERRRGLLFKPYLMAMWLLVGIGVFAFARAGEFGLRYGIFLMPALMILFVRLNRVMVEVFTKKYIRSGMVGFLLVSLWSFWWAWHPVRGVLHNEYRFSPVADLSYKDMILVGSQAAKYLEINYPDAVIYGAFPEIYQLQEPFQGYVQKPFVFRECKDYEYIAGEKTILYIHPYAPGQIPCGQIHEMMETRPLEKYRFVSNDTWIELYEIVGPKSAQATGVVTEPL